MKKLLSFLLVFTFTFGLMGSFSGDKAEAAFTEQKTLTYVQDVKKSNSDVHKIHHEYMFDWIFPTGSGILVTDAYFRLNKAGNVELIDLKPSAKVTFPFQAKSMSKKVLSKKPALTQAGYTHHEIVYFLKGIPGTTSPYTTDVKLSKGKAVKGKKDTYQVIVTFKVTGRDDI